MYSRSLGCRTLLLVATLVMFGSAVSAEEPLERRRLTLFENAQLACKLDILSNAEKANSLVIASKASLQSLCECAAMLTVANASSEDVSAMVTGDKARAQYLLRALSNNFGRCLDLRSPD